VHEVIAYFFIRFESTADTDIEGVLKKPRRAFLFTNVGSHADKICQTGTPLLLPKAYNDPKK